MTPRLRDHFQSQLLQQESREPPGLPGPLHPGESLCTDQEKWASRDVGGVAVLGLPVQHGQEQQEELVLLPGQRYPAVVLENCDRGTTITMLTELDGFYDGRVFSFFLYPEAEVSSCL